MAYICAAHISGVHAISTDNAGPADRSRHDHRAERSAHRLERLLLRAGVRQRSADAVLRLDGMMRAMRRRLRKHQLGARAIADLGLDIDLALLDALAAIEGDPREFADGGSEETMVSTIAERLGIDPSRASRLAGDAVDKGYAVRVASQADARRTLIRLTPEGEAVVEAVRQYKYLVMGRFLDGWSDDEVVAFLSLLERFSSWNEQGFERDSPSKADIADLLETLRQRRPQPA